MNYAVILASGSGTRFGSTTLKQMARIAGKRLYEHTLAAFQAHPEIHGIVLVGNQAILAHAEPIRALFPKIVRVIEGGTNRADSTCCALDVLGGIAAPHDKVLIHDAVRPFVSAFVISSVVSALDGYDAVDTVVDSTDTVVVVEDGVVTGIPDRSTLKRGQTPQGFRLGKLQAAFARYLASDRSLKVTDDCAIYMHFRGPKDSPVRAVAGAQENIKVTFSNDLLQAEEIFRLGFAQAIWVSASLAGKVAVVFGGGSGIGARIVERLRSVGVRVHSYSRANGCDVRDEDAVRRAIADIQAADGRIDHVLCVAGVLHSGAIDKQPDRVIDETIDTNLRGAIHVARASYPALRVTKGHLVLFSSSSYTRGRADCAVYSATKAAIANLSQGLAEEWMQDGVKVNCIAPARTDTAMRSAHFSDSDQPAELIDPVAVAEHVERILQSDLTGQILHVSKARGERLGL